MLELEPQQTGRFYVLHHDCFIGEIVKLSIWCFRCLDRANLDSSVMRGIADKLDELNKNEQGRAHPCV